MGFPGGSEVRNLSVNAGDTVSILRWGRSLREGNGNPLQYSCLGNPIDRRAWWATVHGVTEESDRTYRLSNNSSKEQRHFYHSVLWHTISPHTVNNYLMKTVPALTQKKLRHTITKMHIQLQSLLSRLMRKVKDVPIGVAFLCNFQAISLPFDCYFIVFLVSVLVEYFLDTYLFNYAFILLTNIYRVLTVQRNTLNLCSPPLCMLICV